MHPVHERLRRPTRSQILLFLLLKRRRQTGSPRRLRFLTILQIRAVLPPFPVSSRRLAFMSRGSRPRTLVSLAGLVRMSASWLILTTTSGYGSTTSFGGRYVCRTRLSSCQRHAAEMRRRRACQTLLCSAACEHSISIDQRQRQGTLQWQGASGIERRGFRNEAIFRAERRN